jgi:hypothetical protein
VVALNTLDLDLILVFAAVVGAALIARWTRLPTTALEIIAGIILIAVLGFTLPVGTDSIITLGGLFIVFLAGFETGFGRGSGTSLRRARCSARTTPPNPSPGRRAIGSPCRVPSRWTGSGVDQRSEAGTPPWDAPAPLAGG